MFKKKKFFYKFSLCLILIFLLLGSSFITGCTHQEYINDRETGEIDSGKASELQDGHYILISRYYDHLGYRQILDASVYSGLISVVSCSETTSNGSIKTNSAEWPKEQTGLTLQDIYHHFSSQIIEKQNAKIDAITGATKTSSDYIALSEGLIATAKDGNSGETMVCLGDTYTVESDSQTGIHSILTITFDNADQITSAVFTETLNGVNRSANTIYRELYSDMCDQTIILNTLSPITENTEYPEECKRYNTLLALIEQQRNGII